jgi:inosine triphosphate pyrophosphatase
MPPKQLNFITGNKNKLAEVKAILGDTVELQSQSLDLVEIQGTIEEISADKCRRAAEAVSILSHVGLYILRFYRSKVPSW